jgi:hypothetical protein
MDRYAFERLAPGRLVIEMRPAYKGVSKPVGRIASDGTVALDISPNATQAANAWLRLSLGGFSSGVGPLNQLPIIGAAILMTRPWYERVARGKEIAKSLLLRAQPAGKTNDWVVLVGGETDRDAVAALERLTKEKPIGPYDGVAIVDMAWAPPASASMSPVATRWHDVIGLPYIPYATEARTFATSNAHIAYLADTFRRMGRRRKSRSK